MTRKALKKLPQNHELAGNPRLESDYFDFSATGAKASNPSFWCHPSGGETETLISNPPEDTRNESAELDRLGH
ncbi:hypothetical protein [Jannaschia seosinensis]|uniref:hypothetical protein n=1 Tax=Jannaschia seosinensis TaxID=313367 RepID=UPI000A4BA475|nr:hypothetical protein [Jannaschia seosinensis]